MRVAGDVRALAIACTFAIAGCTCRKTDGGAKTMSVAKPLRVECPAGILAAREGGLDPDRYVVPDEVERNALRDAMAVLAATDPAAASVADANAKLVAAGFEAVPINGSSMVIVRETTKKRGGGVYLVRPGGGSRIVVQAPHTFFDEGTLPLACELFERTQGVALFVETAHRYKSAPKNEKGESPADVAHARDSLFQAATEGVVRARPKAIVVQLHGFAEREGGVAIVLSGGVKTMGVPIVSRVHTALENVIPGVARFPEDSSELGATTNVQGGIVREAGGQFLHVEMAAPLRRDLLSNPTLRASVLGKLADALEGA